MDYLKNLNKKQKSAVEANSGPILIVAGPGTGKTRTLTYRIAYLLENSIKAKDIAALTFTRKAAAEMQERVKKLSSTTTLPFIGTFHSLAKNILENKSEEINIINDEEREKIIKKLTKKSAYKDLFKEHGIRELSLLISRYKNANKKDGFPENLFYFVEDYNQELEHKNLLDYDDLLIKAHTILKSNKSKKYPHILIDEFQDTSEVQYGIAKSLLKRKNIFAIGDPKQSIYAFRGSQIQIFERFEKDFPNAKRINLETNYRSAENLIKVSQKLFTDTSKLKAHRQTSGKASLVKTFNQYSEADWILSEVNKKVGGIDMNFAGALEDQSGDAGFSDFAVVYRTHFLRRALEKKLLEFGVPYQIVGGGSMYAEKHINFLISCLKYIQVPDDIYVEKIAENKAVDTPISGIKQALRKIRGKYAERDVSEIAQKLVEEFNIEKITQKDDIKSRSLKEFISTTVRFDRLNQGLKKLLEHIEYLETHEFYDERADKITLMTMHASKGLEFPCVFILGFEEGVIPLSKAISDDETEEEKRLLYVAMTRAMDELQLLTTEKRGGKKTKQSQFKKLIESDELKVIEDPATEKIKKRIEKNKVEQQNLF